MDELIRRAMEEDDDSGETAASEPEDQDTSEEPRQDSGGKDPADEDIFILDGEDDSDGADEETEKDQLRSMIEAGGQDAGDEDDSRGIQELANEHDEEQSIPRGGDTGQTTEGRRRERQPNDQRAEARARSEAKTSPVEEAEAISRSQQAGMGQTAEARNLGGNEPEQKEDAGETAGDTADREQQASSSDASAERLQSLSDPNDSPETDSPSQRYRELKEEARQEFLEQERQDNEAEVEKQTDSLKEKYDRLGDEYVVN